MPKANPKKNIIPTTASTSVPEALPAGSVKFGLGKALKVLTFTNVKDGRILTSDNDAKISIKKFNLPAFVGNQQTQDDFDIHKYQKIGNIDVCAAHLSNSPDLKEQVKADNIVEIPISDSISLYAVSHYTQSSSPYVMSFNKTCAVMALQILRCTTNEYYDWKEGAYKSHGLTSTTAPKKEILNRLAGVFKIPNDSEYYWMVVPGYEFLYDAYPIEVIALTMVRLVYRSEIHIPESVSSMDIVSSCVAKINRRHDLTKTNVLEVVKQLGEDTTRDMFLTFSKNIGMSGKEARNQVAMAQFVELCEKWIAMSNLATAD